MKPERLVIPGLGVFVLIGGKIMIAPPLSNPTKGSPMVTERQGGARITDQPQRGNDFDGDGRRVEAKPGADEQGRWRFWDNDDDDPTGSTGDGTFNGSIDSDFDAMEMIAHIPPMVWLMFGAILVVLAGMSRFRAA